MSRKIGIAPSILAADFGHLADEISKVEKECEFLHIDVMDGHYVPNISVGIPVINTVRNKSDLIFDVHLMITNPRQYVKAFADAGADYLTFHIECDDDPTDLIRLIRSYGMKAGIAIHPDLPIERIYPYLMKGAVDLILLMSVRPGFGGQAFLEGTTEKLVELRRRLENSGSDAILSVDGGVKVSTIKDAVSSGASLLVCGSAVFGKEDPGQAIKDLLEAAQQE